ncbi:hypothetical protein KUC3_36310 [Alteromonas sp. KC3]|uniref:hypothetical protein n=1 Tax=unclassified Alteromonas TaxID=2614992 RepID=UPI0019231840|nr:MULTISPECIES: hypothetical protein [unclassified Alteromonas]BCO20774.1 hypothetical protein KUC3_36310 [Alteromonas sp. KC3]BCO24743.1 hypothetical protein KUC14_36120 [Alteromonas sp. KC14]
MSISGHFKRFWRFHGLILGAMSISVLTLGCAVQEPAFYEGTWVVTESYQSGADSGSGLETKRILGRSITYEASFAKLDQYQCDTPTYASEDLNVEELQRQYHVSAQALGFSDDTITQVQLDCASLDKPLGATLLFQENTYAYTTIDGVFFKLEKTL